MHPARSAISCFFFFFNDTATTEIYTPLYTLSLHDALPICCDFSDAPEGEYRLRVTVDARSEEHTSELQSHSGISYAVFCLKKKKKKQLIILFVFVMILSNKRVIQQPL